jgi:hypothetical protein
MKKIILLSTFIILLLSCKNNTKQTQTAEPYKLQQTLYHGGDIITMAGEEPNYVEALVQR